MKMMILSTACAVGAILTVPAMAAPTSYAFTFAQTVPPVSGTSTGTFSGQFSVEDGLIVGITGSGVGIGTITALYAPGTFTVIEGYPANDNVFSPTPPYLTFGGVAFQTSILGGINLYRGSGNSINYYTQSQTSFPARGILTVASLDAGVPEPATWGMMLAGFGMVGAGLRSRRRSTSVTFA